MTARAAAAAPVAAPEGLAAIAGEVQACRRCPLWRGATQAVPAEGPEGARIMIVGEQPGDREDLEGRPFVGPAGEVLDRALAAAGLARGEVLLTNAVKHFKTSRAASGGCTRPRRRARSTCAASGWTPSGRG